MRLKEDETGEMYELRKATLGFLEVLEGLVERIRNLETVTTESRPMQRIPDILEYWREEVNDTKVRNGKRLITDTEWENYINSLSNAELLEKLDRYDHILWEARQPR